MAMADGVRRRLGADVGLSTTGVAGPAEQDGQPPGTVWLGVAVGDEVERGAASASPATATASASTAVISLLDLLRHQPRTPRVLDRTVVRNYTRVVPQRCHTLSVGSAHPRTSRSDEREDADRGA